MRLNGNVARVFNEKWLGSSDGLFILSGVVNRIDRRDFDPAYCGELRFIYRLGYEVRMNGKTYASRMPFHREHGVQLLRMTAGSART